MDSEELSNVDKDGNPVKHRRGRLKSLLGEELNDMIKPVPIRGYRLALEPTQLAMLQIKDEFGLVEVGIDELPVGTFDRTR